MLTEDNSQLEISLQSTLLSPLLGGANDFFQAI